VRKFRECFCLVAESLSPRCINPSIAIDRVRS